MKHPPSAVADGVAVSETPTAAVNPPSAALRRDKDDRAPCLLLNFMVSGNDVTLYPSFNEIGDLPGAMAAFQTCAAANVCGNILRAGGYGLAFYSGCSTNASSLTITWPQRPTEGIGLSPFGGSLQSAYIFSNVIGQGVSFHLQMPYTATVSAGLSETTYIRPTYRPRCLYLQTRASTAIHIFQ